MRWCTMLLLGVLFVTAAGAVPKGNVVTLAGDVWAPYVTENQSHPGYLVEVARAAFDRAGLRLQVQIVPWTRALEMISRGQADGVVGIFHDQAHDRGLVVPEEPLARSSNHAFVVPANPWRYAGPASLAPLTIGIVAGYDYGDLNAAFDREVAAGTGHVQAQAGNGALALNLQKLLKGRLDVVIDDPLVVRAQTRALGLADLVDAGAVTPPADLGVAFVGDAHGVWLAQRLAEGMHQLRASGELSRIAGQYGL